MQRINISSGQITTVDDEDYAQLNSYTWSLACAGPLQYAVRVERRKSIFMHRVIMNAKTNEIVDHKDGNGLNNTRDNLRIVTQSVNLFYRHRFRANKTGYRGVRPTYGRYSAQIKCNNIQYHLGTFDTIEEAAEAWNAAAIKLYGKDAPKSKLPPRVPGLLANISLSELLKMPNKR